MNTQRMLVRRVAALGVSAAMLGLIAPAAIAQSQTTPNTSQTVALSAEAEALRTALASAFGAGSEVVQAYAARGFAPIWLTAGDSGDARALTAALKSAHEHALPDAKYRGSELEAALSAPSPELEASLTKAFIEYATDVSSGLLEPRSVDRELHVFPERPAPAALLQAAGNAPDMARYLAGLPPANPIYKRLVERYAAFQVMASQDIWGPVVSNGRTMRPGDTNPRVAEARARLTAMGDLDPNVYEGQTAAPSDGTQIASNEVASDAVPALPFDPARFDEPMVAALQSFQARHGLNLDGVIGPATLRQLNVTPATRARQIAVNLERLRWMNRDLGERHILVNLAGFTMAIYNQGREEFTSRVVVGKARKHRTPEFSKEMTHMIVNPSWHVPRSIATEEILPKLQADPNYLANRGMRVVGADTSGIDWTTVTPGTFPGRITQKPGRGNALGTVKFMFPNRFAIYLHDTPSKRLFERDIRAYSHGCVRVQRPHELAAYLLRDQQADPEGYFRTVLNAGRERRINLDAPLPVHLTYRSAWIDDDGVEQFRGDIYGRDKRISAALARAGVSLVE